MNLKTFKQVIVVNEALGLPPGKMAAQVAHAAVGGLLNAPREKQSGWLQAGMPKVVLRCGSEDELFALAKQAEAAGLPVMLIRDAGRTVVEAGTPTCVGIGPDEISKIDAVTGALKLMR
jgi:PTH2 family peptidyl-tRNA hydrolase